MPTSARGLLAAAEGNPFFLEQMVAMRQETGPPPHSGDDPGRPRGAHRCADPHGARRHRLRRDRRPPVPSRRRRRAAGGARSRFARAGARLARPARPDPPGTPGPARRGGVSLLAHPDPRGGLHAPPEGPARRPARALRPPGSRHVPSATATRRDHRLPLRAGLPVLDRSAAGAGVRPSPSGPRRRPPSGPIGHLRSDAETCRRPSTSSARRQAVR